MRILVKILRGIAWTLLSLLTLVCLVIVGALLWARSDSGRAHIRSIVLREAHKSVPGLEIGHIGGDFTRSLELRDLRIRDLQGRDAVKVSRIAVRYDLLALLHHRIDVESVAIEQPELLVRPGEDGRLNVTELVTPAPQQKQQKPFHWAIAVRRLTVEGGAADVVTTGGAQVEAQDLHLDAKMHRQGETIDLALRSLGVRARYGGKPYAVGLTGKASGPLEHVDLDLEAWLPRGGQARVTGFLAVGQPEAHYDLTLDAHDIDVPSGIEIRRVRAHVQLLGQKLDANLETQVGAPRKASSEIVAHASGTLPDHLSIEAKGHGENIVAGKVRIGRFDLTAQASDLPKQPRGNVKLDVRRIDLAPDRRIDRVGLVAESDGRHLRANASLRAPQQFVDLAVHGAISVRKLDVTIDRLQAAAPQGKVKLLSPASIRLAMGQKVEIDHTKVRVDSKSFSGELALQALYRFKASRLPRAVASIRLRNGVAFQKQKIEADTHAEIDQTSAHATVDAAFGPSRTPLHIDMHVPVVANRKSGVPQLATKGPLVAHLTAKDLKLADLPMDLSRQGVRGGVVDLSAVVEGFVEKPTAHANVTLHGLTLQGLSGLGAELSLETTPDHTKLSGRTTLRNRTLVSLEGDTPLALKHVLAKAPLPDLPLAVTVHAPALDLADFAPLSDKLEGYGGIARLTAKIGGTVRHPIGQAQMGIAGAHVDQIEFGPMTLDARLDDRQLVADFSTVAVTAGGMQMQARVTRTPGYPLDVKLEARQLDIAFMRALTPGLRDLGGILTASLHVTGTAKAPVMSGDVSFDKGTLGIVGEPTWHDVTAKVAIVPGTIDVQKLHLKSGDGHFDAHGQIQLAGTQVQRVSLVADADDFRVAVAGAGNARLNGRFAIEAALREDVLSGKVQIPEARLWLPKMISSGKKVAKTTPPPDLIFVDRAGIKAAVKAAEKQNVSGHETERVDVSAKLGTLYVQSKDMNLEITADTQVTTGPTGAPAVSGGVTVRRGHIMIKDQRFDFDHGEIMFDGTEQINPGLDIRLSHEYPEVTAIVEVHGTLKHPEMRFSSDPPIYDQAGVIGLIMTGGQVGGDPSSSQFNAEAAVTNALLGALADNLAPALGLDVLRVGGTAPDQTGQNDNDTRVEVGKYLSPRIYLSFVHVFGDPGNLNTNEAHVEYRMTRRWVMETAFGDAGVGGVDFLWTYRY